MLEMERINPDKALLSDIVAQRLTQQVLTENLGPRLKALVDQVQTLMTGQGTTADRLPQV